MKYVVTQGCNNGKVKNYFDVDTDSATMQSIIDLMPKGQTVFSPTPTGAQGTARIMLSIYREGRVMGSDRTDKRFNSSFVRIQYGKPGLTDDDIVLACDGKLKVPNGTTADKISVKKLKTVGA